MSDTSMTDEQFKSELSPEYLEWSERDGDCGIMIPVDEIQRLAEVIVGLRACIAELADLREQCRGMEIRDTAGNGIIIEQTAEIDRQTRELEQLRAEFRRAKGYPENPCTGAEFADATLQSIKPRSDEEIRDIIADVEGEPAAQPSGEGTGR